jgi:2-(3-amino-3-carboxypropyl)histidine synthase
MNLGSFTIDIAQVQQLIEQHQYTRIALQLPEGLKQYVFTLVEAIEHDGSIEVFVVVDPCYGACDLIGGKLKHLGIDAVFQLGHTSLGVEQKNSIPTYFINVDATNPVSSVIKKVATLLEGKTIGVVTTAQHLHQLDEIKQLLQKQNVKVVIGSGSKRVSAPGQILGCDFSAATTVQDTVDEFLYVGSGRFHPLGLQLATEKSVTIADPTTGEIVTDELHHDKENILRQRYGLIATAQSARSVGILVGSKPGQCRMKTAQYLRHILQEKQKKSVMMVVDYLTPDMIDSFRGIDCIVSTLCPRLALDDAHRYKIPVLTPLELEIVLGLKSWEEYSFDTFITE